MKHKFQDHKRAGRIRQANIRTGFNMIFFCLLGLMAFAVGAGLADGEILKSGVLAAGMLAVPGMRLFKEADGGGDGGEAAFQGKVLSVIERVQKQNEEFGANFGNFAKETKTAIEDLRKQRDADVVSLEGFQKALAKVNLQMARETRMALGSPSQRIAGNEQLRSELNGLVRMHCDYPLSDSMKKALSETATPGSTYISDGLAMEIYDSLARYGVWNTFGVRTVSKRTTKFPVKTARPVASFLNSSRTLSDDSTKAGTSVDLTVLPIGVLLAVARELLEDAEIDVTSDLLDDFSEAVAYRMDWACLQADGTDDNTDGAMTGIFGGGGTAVGAASGNTTVETLDFEDFVNTIIGVDAAVLTRAAKWWMHPQILARVLKIKDSNGRSIFLTANEAPTYGGIGSILGYPVIPAMAAPSTNTASSKVAVFGDPNAVVAAVATSFQFEGSDHAGWTTYERSFRGIARFGSKVRKQSALGVLTLAAS